MSERGGGGGGGGGRSSRTGKVSRASGAGGGGNRTSHFKLVESDPKYGMLLWQSKLQEKLLQEVCYQTFPSSFHQYNTIRHLKLESIKLAFCISLSLPSLSYVLNQYRRPVVKTSIPILFSYHYYKQKT
jgi:hypothetical protein